MRGAVKPLRVATDNVLELAAGTGALTGFSEFAAFPTITVDDGGAWTVNGSYTRASGLTLSGLGTLTSAGRLTLAAGGTLYDAGALANTGTLAVYRGSLLVGAGVPMELGTARDPRSLGVAVSQIALSQGRQLKRLEANDPSLVSGFHAFEPENGFRWTDGDALLPSGVFHTFEGPLELLLHLGATTCYPDEGEQARAA